jgi:hypothetical protein
MRCPPRAALGGLLGLISACSGSAFHGDSNQAVAPSTLVADAELTEPSSLDSIAAREKPQAILDFAVQDAADGRPTAVDELVLRVVASTDAAPLAWTLESDAGKLTGRVSGAVGAQRVTFAAAGLEVVDGGAKRCVLSVQAQSAVPDNTLFRIEVLGGDQVVAQGSSPFAAEARVDNAAGFSHAVTASTLSVPERPPATVMIDQPFDLFVAFTDAHGNFDTDVDGDVVDVYRDDDGTWIGSAIAADGVVSFSGQTELWLTEPANPELSLVVVDDEAGHSNLSGTIPLFVPLVLNSDNDADGVLAPSDALAEPQTIDIAAAEHGPVPVLDFTISDGGGGDGLGTSLLALHVLATGSLDAAEHSWELSGPDLIEPLKAIVFSEDDLHVLSFWLPPIEVADGAADTYTIALRLEGGAARVGDQLQLWLDWSTVESFGTMVSAGSVDNGDGLALVGPVADVSLSGADWTPIYGGTSKAATLDACPAGQVVVGYDVTTADSGKLLVSSVSTVCAELAVIGGSSLSLVTEPGATLAQRGNTGTQTFSERCPENHVVVGFHGASGGAVDRLGIHCSPLIVSAEQPATITLGEVWAVSAEGGPDGTAFDQRCPTGQLATGTVTRVSNTEIANFFVSLEAFGLVCSTPSFTSAEATP